MADNTNNIRGAIETNQASADTMLSSLPGKVVNHGKHAVAGVLAGLAIAVSSPAQAQTTPVAPSISASAPVDQRGTTVVEMKNGEKVTLAELLKRENAGETNIMALLASRGEMKKYSDFKTLILNQVTERTEGKKEALNQTAGKRVEVREVLDQKVKEEKNVDEALNQQHALKDLLNELLDAGSGISPTPEDKWKMKASTVTAVLENPLSRPKNPETVQLLQNIEASLKKGINPFVYQSPDARTKMMAMMR